MDTALQFEHWLSTSISELWVIKIFFVILITAIVHTIEYLTVRRLLPKCAKTTSIWDDALLKSFHKPFAIFIWVAGLSYAIQFTAHQTENLHIFALVPSIRQFVVLALVIWFLVRFVSEVEATVLQPKPGQEPYDKTTVNAVAQILKVSVVVTGLLVGMQMYNIPISGVLAFGGIGGAAVAFAAKDLLGNFFGGLMIFLDRPFSVGDRILSTTLKFDGTVEYIGWRLTRIRTRDKRALYVPNGLFSTMAIENPSRMTHRRINQTIGIRYDDAKQLQKIVSTIDEYLLSHPELDQRQKNFARFTEFAESSLNIIVNGFTNTIDWLQYQTVQQEIFIKVIEIIEEHGAQCAFPTRTIHMQQD